MSSHTERLQDWLGLTANEFRLLMYSAASLVGYYAALVIMSPSPVKMWPLLIYSILSLVSNVFYLRISDV